MHALLQTTNLRQMGIGQETYPCEVPTPRQGLQERAFPKFDNHAVTLPPALVGVKKSGDAVARFGRHGII